MTLASVQYHFSIVKDCVGGCGEEKGFKGKGNPSASSGHGRRSRLRIKFIPSEVEGLVPPFGGARFPQNFSRRLKIRKGKEEKMCRCPARPCADTYSQKLIPPALDNLYVV